MPGMMRWTWRSICSRPRPEVGPSMVWNSRVSIKAGFAGRSGNTRRTRSLMFLLRAHRPETFREGRDAGSEDIERHLKGAKEKLAARLESLFPSQPLQMMTPIERATLLAGISDAEAALLLYDWPFWAVRNKCRRGRLASPADPRRTRLRQDPDRCRMDRGRTRGLSVVSVQP